MRWLYAALLAILIHALLASPRTCCLAGNPRRPFVGIIRPP